MPHTNPVPLTDEQIEMIAERAAEKAMKKLTEDAYMSIGKGVVSKAFWIIGMVATALFFWLAQKGIIKL